MHENFLKLALAEAFRGKGTSYPNPAVGAVLVHGSQVLTRGFHALAGHAHAEINALNAAADASLADATLYVTLEPCAHWGRTAPCTEAIVARGIRKVVFAFTDPNPNVAGAGATKLRAQGVEALHVPLPEIDQFYAGYAFWLRTERPYVTAKIATSLNARISGAQGIPKHFSSPTLDEITHLGRRQSCAFLTTAQTLLADNPRFNIRLASATETRPLYVLDTVLRTPAHAQIWSTAGEKVFFHGASAPATSKEGLRQQGARLEEVPVLESGKLCLSSVFRKLQKDGLHDLWVECGGRLLTSLLGEYRVDRLLWYQTPFWEAQAAKPALSPGWRWRDVPQHSGHKEKRFGSERIHEMYWQM